MKSLFAIMLFIAAGLFTACGPDEDKNEQARKADSDSIARVRIQHEQDSIAWRDSISKLPADTLVSTVPPIDSAELMQMMGILDSIKALKNK